MEIDFIQPDLDKKRSTEAGAGSSIWNTVSLSLRGEICAEEITGDNRFCSVQFHKRHEVKCWGPGQALEAWQQGLRSGGWPHYRGRSWSRRRCSSTDTCYAVAGSCPPRASRSITSMPSGRVSGFIRMRTTLRGSSRLLREPSKMPTGS
ncbi:hypothetical protein MJT46_014544 [Ovis ammon polii x Ovis aries]|nr:hypothetical protein MJT46_014544 [Ovis ammon polii x Ovis aries]